MLEQIDLNIEEVNPSMSELVMKSLQENLIVVIKGQSTNPIYVSRLIHNMSHIANFGQMNRDTDGNWLGVPEGYIDPWSVDSMPVQRVTGEKKGEEFTGIFPVGELDWHANLNGPTRADGVALQGIRDVAGTVTSWINTAVAVKAMKEELPSLYDDLYDVWCDYRYEGGVGWSTPANDIQYKYMMQHVNEYSMRVLQQNVAGVDGLYLYTNNNQTSQHSDLIEEVQKFLHQERFMYHHEWEVGDIVLSDQLLTLHKRKSCSDEVLRKRLLHRWTFPISNAEDPEFILKRNLHESLN
jgi:hypothetical protein